MYYWNMLGSAVDTIIGGFNGNVRAVLIDSGYIYCGGEFTVYNGSAAPRIAKINIATKTLDTTFDPTTGFASTVYCFVLSGSDLYVGGAFATYKGTNRSRVAKISALTAALDTTFDSATGFGNPVYSMVLDGGYLYCGGDFTAYKSTTRQRVAKLNASTAALDTTFDSASGFGNIVYALQLSGSDLYVGGSFTTYNGVTRQRIAKLNSSTAALDTTFDSSSGCDNTVYSLFLSGTSLYVGGEFAQYKTVNRSRIIKVSTSTAAMDATFDMTAGGFSSYVTSIVVDGSDLYCGGNFTTYRSTARERIAKLNSSTAALDTTFDSASGFGGLVWSIALVGTSLYCGGVYPTYKLYPKDNLGKISSSDASSLSCGT